MNQGIDEPSLACVIERIAELMQALVHFALSPRMERHLERFIVEAAGSHEVLIEDETIDAIDRFARRRARLCWTSSWPAARI